MFYLFNIKFFVFFCVVFFKDFVCEIWKKIFFEEWNWEEFVKYLIEVDRDELDDYDWVYKDR